MAAPLIAGIDIGATSLRAVEVKRTRSRPTIERLEQVPLPEGAVVGGVVKDEKAVTAALKQLRANKMFASKSVSLAVTHQQVVVREVEVANLPPEEMRLALPHQVRDVMPLPVDEAILDFVPLHDPGKADTVRGLLAAAPREAVVHTVEAVEKAGLHVDRVDLACFAVLRSVAAMRGGAEAIVEIGASATLVVFHVDGVPHVVRTIPRGGHDVTQLLSRRLGTSLAEAEARKIRLGLVGDDVEHAEAVAEALRPLVSELRSSMGYWASHRPEPIARVTLVGGGAQLRGLTEALTATLQVPTALGNPLQYVGASHRSGPDTFVPHRAAAAVAVGLTLGATA